MINNSVSINACRTLVSINGFAAAPVKTSRVGDWVECVIGIDNDNCAHLTMTREAFEVLKEADSARFDIGDMFGDEV